MAPMFSGTKYDLFVCANGNFRLVYRVWFCLPIFDYRILLSYGRSTYFMQKTKLQQPLLSVYASFVDDDNNSCASFLFFIDKFDFPENKTPNDAQLGAELYSLFSY